MQRESLNFHIEYNDEPQGIDIADVKNFCVCIEKINKITDKKIQIKTIKTGSTIIELIEGYVLLEVINGIIKGFAKKDIKDCTAYIIEKAKPIISDFFKSLKNKVKQVKFTAPLQPDDIFWICEKIDAYIIIDNNEDDNNKSYKLNNPFTINEIKITKNADILLIKEDKEKLKQVEKIEIKKENKEKSVDEEMYFDGSLYKKEV